MATTQNITTGRRKESVARVRLVPGTGNITVNGRPLDEYFGRETSKMILVEPLKLVDQMGKLDVHVNATGGGLSGQAGAIRPRDAVADRAGLAGQPSPVGVHDHVHLAHLVDELERLDQDHLRGLAAEVLVEGAPVDGDVPGSREEPDARDRNLAATRDDLLCRGHR